MQYMTIECKIEYLVCKVFKVGPLALKDKRRSEPLIFAKHAYRYLMASLIIEDMITGQRSKREQNDICLAVSCKRHCLAHSIKTAKNLIETDKDYRLKFETIISKLDTKLFEL